MSTIHPLESFGAAAVEAQPDSRPAAVLPERALIAARVAFVAFTFVAIWLGAMTMIRSVQSADGLWLAAIGDPTDAQEALNNGGFQLFQFVFTGTLEILRVVTYLAVATLLVWRSRKTIAFLVALLLISSVGADFPPNLFAMISTEPVRAILGLFVTYWFPLMLVVIFYVFPDGRFTPRWTIVPAILWAGSLAQTFIVTRSLDGPDGWQRLIIPSLLLTSIVIAQTYRYRRISGPVERQQTKWFLSGLGFLLLTFAGGNVVLAATGGFQEAPPESAAIIWPIFETVTALASIFLAIALLIAVFRYRLFDLDLIINRALVYGGLTVAVVGIYVLVVGYLGALFRTGGNLMISLVATALVAILFQPLRDRMQRAANRVLYGQRDEPYAVVARLGRMLEASIVPDAVLPTIANTVAGALKLPYVAIALETDGVTAIAAESGSVDSSTVEVVPLVYQGEQVGELRLAPRPGERALAPADRRLIVDLARQAGVAVHAVQLTRDLQRTRERLVAGREEERRRLRRDLHDGLGPALASQALTIDTARLLVERDPHGAIELLREATVQSHAAVSEIRRVVYALRPPALDDLGLVGALRDAASRYTGRELDFSVEAPETLPPLPAATEVAIFRIAQEAMTNVVRHARASHCRLTLSVGSSLGLVISDDGIGLPVNRRAGVGLASMRERAEELGGTCTITRGPNGGTTVTAWLPF